MTIKLDFEGAPLGRDEALRAGSKFYLGPKCYKGHKGLRYISGPCIECARVNSRLRYSPNPGPIGVCKRCGSPFKQRYRKQRLMMCLRCRNNKNRQDQKLRSKKMAIALAVLEREGIEIKF